MRIREKENYKPVYILNYDAWEVFGHVLFDAPMDCPTIMRYTGSLPVSLDSLKIWELCDKQKNRGKAPHMRRFLMTKEESGKKYSNAVINLKFAEKMANDTIWSLAAFLENHTEEMQEKEREAYLSFRKAYEENQKLRNAGKDARSGEERRRRNEERINSVNACRDTLKSFLKACAEHRMVIGQAFKIGVVRRVIYERGLQIKTQDGVCSYSLYKRSASKSRSGDCLFLWSEIADEMMDWSWMGKRMAEGANCDLTSVRAYEALVQSSLIGRVSIPPESILLIDRVESDPVTGNRRILVQKDKNSVCLMDDEEYRRTFKKDFIHTNVIWDGQALVDESVFEEADFGAEEEDHEPHGMMTLRNHFFKACAFNTRIRAYYKEHGIETVTDMFGREHRAEDIRMIVTPDSLKWLKFADSFFGGSAEKAYRHWLKKMIPGFGIVKTEKASKLGRGQYHEAGYQTLNTLPLAREDVRKLMAEDLDYLEKLRTDEAYLLSHLKYMETTAGRRYFLYTMYKHIRDFDRTEVFHRMKKDVLEYYEKRLRNGRIKVKGDFYVLCSMPLEMLKYSAYAWDQKLSAEENRSRRREGIREDLQLGREEAWIGGLKDGERITIFRYPHLNAGSVCTLTNKVCEETGKWFHLENKDGCNIIVVSPWENNLMVRLGGADFDSDTVFYIRDSVIQKAAGSFVKKGSEKNLFDGILSPGEDGLPVAVADESSIREEAGGAESGWSYTAESMAKLDHGLAHSGSTVGIISDSTQICNSNLWDVYYGETGDRKARMREIYGDILTLSVLNEVEIDRSKHATGLQCRSLCAKIMKERSENGTIRNYKTEREIKPLKPLFMRQGIPAKEAERQEEYFRCPVDQIGSILDERQPEKKREKRITLKDLFDRLLGETGSRGRNDRQLNDLKDLLTETAKKLDELNRKIIVSTNADDEMRELDEERRMIREACVNRIIKKRNVRPQTMVSLYKWLLGKGNKNTSIALGLLFMAGEKLEEEKKENFIMNCLNLGESCRDELVRELPKDVRKAETEEVVLFGDIYYRIKRNTDK